MDLTATIVPKSDQKNADDFLSGPQTFTITAEIEYADEQQPAGFVLDGDTGHPYKPNKSMRRVLDVLWGKGSYVGRRITLCTDPTVKFGGKEVGGIVIAAMSGIPGEKKFNLTETKGKKKPHVVRPLPDAAPTPAPAANRLPEPSAERVAACTDKATLDRMWQASGPERQAQIEARMFELGITGDAS